MTSPRGWSNRWVKPRAATGSTLSTVGCTPPPWATTPLEWNPLAPAVRSVCSVRLQLWLHVPARSMKEAWAPLLKLELLQDASVLQASSGPRVHCSPVAARGPFCRGRAVWAAGVDPPRRTYPPESSQDSPGEIAWTTPAPAFSSTTSRTRWSGGVPGPGIGRVGEVVGVGMLPPPGLPVPTGAPGTTVLSGRSHTPRRRHDR